LFIYIAFVSALIKIIIVDATVCVREYSICKVKHTFCANC